MVSEKTKNMMPIYIGFSIQMIGVIAMFITKNFPLGLISCAVGIFIMVIGASRKVGNTNVFRKYSYKRPAYYTGDYALKLFIIRSTFILIPILLLLGTISLLFSLGILTPRGILLIAGIRDSSSNGDTVNELLKPSFSTHFNYFTALLYFSGSVLLAIIRVWLRNRWKV
ncbi:MAG: hypothetical protein ABIE55_00940 [Candidatus Aenigmatarchaeota archaeon]